MPDLILELYSEEIPAFMQLTALDNLKNMFSSALAEGKLSFSNIEGYVSARRLTIIAQGIPGFIDAEQIERKGPKIDANPSAIAGFLKSVGKSDVGDLVIKTIDEKKFYFAEINMEEQNSAAIIAEFLPKILSNFPWPKSMKWGNYKISWVRPLHNIMCLFADEILEFEFGHLSSNNFSFGHRFMAPEKFEVKSITQYFNELKARHVEYDQDQRKNKILQECRKIADSKNITLIEDADLLEEVSGLVELVNPLLGNIDQKYMELPEEVLISSIKKNQRYFCFRKGEKLANFFVTIANVKTKNDQIIINGNQKVLSARLEDALFFWQQDLETKLEQNVEKLKSVTFHKKLGSVYDKIMRMEKISHFLASYNNSDKEILSRATLICKADLVTEMVGEFPNLQGVIGKYYALKQGEHPDVASAIEDHYKPIGAGDSAPKNSVSAIVALADKLDSLAGLWIADEKPTSSKDPYGLRRAALGIIRIMIENKISIKLNLILKQVIEVYGEKKDTNLVKEINEFIHNRFAVYIKTAGIRHDIILSVTKNFENIYQDYLKIIELNNFLSSDDGQALAKAYIRASNIVTEEEKKDKKSYDGKIDKSLLETKEEAILFSKSNDVADEIAKALKEQNYFDAMNLLKDLRVPVDNFFDNVTVNCDKNELRTNRLVLLSQIRNLLNGVADFSVLEI